MGMIDLFSAEDRVNVKFTDFYNLVKGCAEREIITNGLKHNVPHAQMLAMLGEPNNSEQEGESHEAQAI